MKVLQVPNKVLRAKARTVKRITPELLKTLKEMVLTTESFVDPEGIGLAANQIGQDGQYFVAETKEGIFKAFINPDIKKFSKRKKLYIEGCLSIINTWGEVERSYWVDVEYLDVLGKKVSERLSGMSAWIFQHEFDHLQGKLFVDRVLEQKHRLFQVVGKDRAGMDIYEEIKI